MRLSRIYVDLPLTGHTEYILTGATAHYLSSVLRVQEGIPLVLFNGQGGQFEAQVQWMRKGMIRVRTGDYKAVERESPLTIFLGHSVCRGERSDYVIQKATELGVMRVDPLLTDRTVVRLAAQRAARRVAHWQSIAVQACEQCGRNRVPKVSSIKPIAEWLVNHPENSSRLILDTNAHRGVGAIPTPIGPVVILVGPEGGLTSQELRLATTWGFSAVNLGPRTLRADTATIAGLVALQLHFGDLS
ncbi:MAG: 16S rRNA (uracil(1498)-N(3))-methyltransferase [Gammaproteobacteria bacterium]